MSETPDAPVPAPEPAPAAVLPPENRVRGTLLALLIIPAGILVWVVVWAIGFIAGIVGIGVALGALALYRWGSRGRISVPGAVAVSVITLVTLVLAFFAGIVSDDLRYFGRALANGTLFESIGAAMSRYGGDLTINVLLLVVFAAIGVFTIFRTAMVQQRELGNENVVPEPPA
jgi:hypothetical protein